MSLTQEVNLVKRQRFMLVGHLLNQKMIKELVKCYKPELIQYVL